MLLSASPGFVAASSRQYTTVNTRLSMWNGAAWLLAGLVIMLDCLHERAPVA
jgi:hypothetical protein